MKIVSIFITLFLTISSYGMSDSQIRRISAAAASGIPVLIPLSPLNDTCATRMPITPAEKKMALSLAIQNEDQACVMKLLARGADFNYGINRAIYYKRPPILEMILDYNKEKDIFHDEAGQLCAEDPVALAASNFHTSPGTLAVLLTDKRVPVTPYIENGIALRSPQLCALFLLAGQGDLTEQNIGRARSNNESREIDDLLAKYTKASALYKKFPGQEQALHEMLLKRNGSGVDHLVKAAWGGNKYLISRLIFTAPQGPFTKSDLFAAHQTAFLNGHKKTAQIFDNADRLSHYLPRAWCLEFMNIIRNEQPVIPFYHRQNAQAGITPELTKARLHLHAVKKEQKKIE